MLQIITKLYIRRNPHFSRISAFFRQKDVLIIKKV